MAWGSKTSATQLTSITATEQFFSTLITLNPRETAHVQVSADWPSTPVDNLVISLYATLDASSETWDLVPFQSFELANVPDPNRVSFTVSGVYKFRVGVKRSGTTTTITSADLSYRIDGVSV
jgi:hypothetical protein